MFGLYYAIAGLFFGFLCSKKAKEKQICNTEWFTVGFALNILAYLLICVIPAKEISLREIEA